MVNTVILEFWIVLSARLRTSVPDQTSPLYLALLAIGVQEENDFANYVLMGIIANTPLLLQHLKKIFARPEDTVLLRFNLCLVQMAPSVVPPVQ